MPPTLPTSPSRIMRREPPWRDSGSDEIAAAVRMAGRGRRYVSDSVMPKIADSYSREPLTRRENDVLHLLAELL